MNVIESTLESLCPNSVQHDRFSTSREGFQHTSKEFRKRSQLTKSRSRKTV